MKTKRKGPRYVANAGASRIGYPILDQHHDEGLTRSEVATLLNACERAKDEVKRLKARIRFLEEEAERHERQHVCRWVED